MNAKVRIWIWTISILVLAIPAAGQTTRGFVWGEDGRLKEVGQPLQWTEPYEGLQYEQPYTIRYLDSEDVPMAADNKVWLGNDVGNEGDWSVAANWDPAGVPTDDDYVAMNPTSNVSVISGLNQDGITLSQLHVHELYTGDIGTSGSPLIIETILKGKVIKQGPGKFYIQGGINTIGIDYLYIDTPEQTAVIEISGGINVASILKGRVVALSGMSSAVVWLSYRSNPTSDVHFTSESTSSFTEVNMNGGTFMWNGSGSVTHMRVASGRVLQDADAGTLNNLQQTGGYVRYDGIGAITTAAILGGTFDLSQDARAKTIGLLAVFPGARFLPNANLTITNNSPGTILPIIDVIP